MNTTATITCPFNRAYHIVLDAAEVFPDDPGNGTPEMLYGPDDSSCTLNFAYGEGHTYTSTGREIEIPEGVYRWLTHSAEVDEAVAAFWEANDLEEVE